MVAALVALCVALGGTAWAAGVLGPCGYLVCRGDIGTGAVDARVVKDRSLGMRELSSAAVRQLRGNPDFAEVQFLFNTAAVPAAAKVRLTVTCPSGLVAIGGGGSTDNRLIAGVAESFPSDAAGAAGSTAWTIYVFNISTTEAANARVDVTCAPI
jgi:hypothetical protein